MIRVYVGWDPRDELAYRACIASLHAHASVPVDVIGLRDHLLRKAGLYWRPYHVEEGGQMVDGRDGRPFSTQFAFTRFAIPLIDRSDDWVVFCDSDMLWRADIADLIALAEDDKTVMCVQHDYQPAETVKMDGVSQAVYARKNWSSLMLLRPARCKRLTPYVVNNSGGRWLHAFSWVLDEDLGALPERWNWLEGWSSPDVDPAIVHHTRGTPDMIGDAIPYADEWWSAVKAWRPEMEVTWDRATSISAS